MKIVRLLNHTQGRVLCPHCEIAANPFTRMKGLLGRTSLSVDAGLLITPCPSVHMVGMKFAIDVLFLSRENRVTDWVENLPAGLKFYFAKARAGADGTKFGKPFAALELPAGTIARNGVRLGDAIVFESVALNSLPTE